jgi:hypothetical protein
MSDQRECVSDNGEALRDRRGRERPREKESEREQGLIACDTVCSHSVEARGCLHACTCGIRSTFSCRIHWDAVYSLCTACCNASLLCHGDGRVASASGAPDNHNPTHAGHTQHTRAIFVLMLAVPWPCSLALHREHRRALTLIFTAAGDNNVTPPQRIAQTFKSIAIHRLTALSASPRRALVSAWPVVHVQT